MQHSEAPRFRYLIFLSSIAALGGFLFGYDTAVISGTVVQVTQQFQLDVHQQGWYVGCALVGSIVGVSVAGWLSDRFGRKKIMLVSAVLFTVSAIGCAIPVTFLQLVFFRIIGGVGIGMVSIVSPLYISEMAVPRFRGSMVSLYQLAITIGFLGAYVVNFQLQNLSIQMDASRPDWIQWIFGEQVWRGMLGMEALPAATFFILIFFIPESPRWLLLGSNETEARLVFQKIYRSNRQVQEKLEEIYRTLGNTSETSWVILTSPEVRRPVLLGVAIAILGQFMGVNAVLYYGPAIFEQTGLSSGDALFYQVWVGLVNVITTLIALSIIDWVGRKSLVYFGVSGMIITLVAIGGYFSWGEAWHIPSIWLLILFLSYIFFTAISISAVIFVLLSEMYPNRIRGTAMSIAGLSLWIGTFLIGQLTPWLLDTLSPTGTFILFAGMCFPYLFIMRKAIPETAGMSLEQIEDFWKRQVTK